MMNTRELLIAATVEFHYRSVSYIHSSLQLRTGESISIATVYTTISRMKAKRLIHQYKYSTPEKLYKLTDLGRTELSNFREAF